MTGPLVVSQGWVVNQQGRGAELPPAWTLHSLWVKARSVNSSTVFVVDLVHAADLGSSSHADVEQIATGTIERRDEPDLVWRWKVASHDGRDPISVVILGNDQSEMAGPWRGMTAGELRRAFVSFQTFAGVPWSSSTGRTAESLILATHPRANGGRLLDTAPQIPGELRGSGLELPWQSWRRELTEPESQAGFLHVFDQNAQYLAAWVTVELGHGVPIHSTTTRFDKSSVGFWRFAGGLDALPVLRSELPPAWLPKREWYATATVQRMLEVSDGLDVPIPDESWVWPNRSRFLRAAAERLRDARKAATVALADLDAAADKLRTDQDVTEWGTRKVIAAAVADAIKDLYRVQTGRFGWEGRAVTSPWARPDWGHTIRAQARANQHRRLEQLGAAPFAIATDALLFLDDEPDPLVFAERIRLPIGDGLGQFHHDTTARAFEVDDVLLQTGTPSRLVKAAAAVAA